MGMEKVYRFPLSMQPATPWFPTHPALLTQLKLVAC